MKKLFFLFASFLALNTGITSCSNDEDNQGQGNKNNPRHSINITQDEQEIIDAHKSNAFKLLKSANENLKDNDTFVISPLSASFALSMLVNGTADETLEASMKELGLQRHTIEELNLTNTKLIDSLNLLDKRAIVEIANSMWINNGETPLDSYTSVIKDYYKGDVINKDFNEKETLNAINNWCSKATKGNIKEFISEVPSNMPILLINAIYFKAPWNKPFSKDKKGTFTTISGEKQTVEYMSTTKETAYYKNGKCVALPISYGNNAFSLYILLPNDGISVDECIEDLASHYWIDDEENTYYADATIKMPKFSIVSNNSILSSLESSGIRRCFAKDANYTNLFRTASYVATDILQATTFVVDEEGTEASSSTLVGGDLLIKFEKREFTVDRPFLFFVKEQSSGAILFAGKVGRI